MTDEAPRWEWTEWRRDSGDGTFYRVNVLPPYQVDTLQLTALNALQDEAAKDRPSGYLGMVQRIADLKAEADALRGALEMLRDRAQMPWTEYGTKYGLDMAKSYRWPSTHEITTAALTPQPHQPECEHNFQPMYSNWDFQRCVKNCGMFMYREMMLKGEPLPQPYPKDKFKEGYDAWLDGEGGTGIHPQPHPKETTDCTCTLDEIDTNGLRHLEGCPRYVPHHEGGEGR